MSGLLSYFRDEAAGDARNFLQGASNSAASTISAPVDGIAWLMRKMGIPVGAAPVGGSDWMAQRGLTAAAPGKAGLLGEAAGMISPIVAQAKAPQIAGGLLRGVDNINAPGIPNSGQRGMIDIEFRKSADYGKKASLQDGRMIVEWPGIGASPADLADFARAEASKLTSPKYDHFFRFTNNKKEIELAKAKALRPSRNHAENFVEKGLSVADGPHYSTAGYKYGYPVSGKVIGVGSDGEPLLDVMALQPLAKKVMSSEEIAKAGWAAQAEQLQRLGLPRDFLDGKYRFLNDPYTFKPK